MSRYIPPATIAKMVADNRVDLERNVVDPRPGQQAMGKLGDETNEAFIRWCATNFNAHLDLDDFASALTAHMGWMLGTWLGMQYDDPRQRAEAAGHLMFALGTTVGHLISDPDGVNTSYAIESRQ